MSRRIRTASVVLATAGLTAAIMSPAVGDDSQSRYAPGADASIKTKGGELLFFELEGNGIKLAVYDDRKDGYGVRGYAYADGVTATVYTARGKGTHETREFVVPDGSVTIKLCYTQKGKNVQCSKTKKAR